jgi:cell volume regulation protein A
MCGVILGNEEVVQKKSLLRFFDGLAWLGQIGMFLTLGLLVFPSQVLNVAPMGLAVSLFLIVVARPFSVFAALFLSNLGWREKVLISWVGIRGAVPIILATFPFLAHLGNAPVIFNLVFFIVLTSALLQGWSVPFVARLLNVADTKTRRSTFPLEFEAPKGTDTDLVDFIIPYDALVIGKPIVELGLPADSLIVLIIRNEQFIVPSGGTVLEAGDSILALVNKQNLPTVRDVLSEINAAPDS